MTLIRKESSPADEYHAMDKGTPGKRKILFLTANPEETERLFLSQEFRGIQEVLNRAQFRSQFEIQPRLAVRYSDIRQALLDYTPHIVHFAGHGDKDGLMVEGEIGIGVKVQTQVLSRLFASCSRHVECVVLNACFSASQASAIGKHIKYVIGMRKEIEDRAAIKFSEGFYGALGAGRSVENAFIVGRTEILQEFPGLSEYSIPLLKKKKERMIHIRLRIESTGDIFHFEAGLDETTSAVKKRLIAELKFAETFENGQPVLYHLLNKTRNQPADDRKTIRENGTQNNDVFVFLIEADD